MLKLQGFVRTDIRSEMGMRSMILRSAGVPFYSSACLWNEAESGPNQRKSATRLLFPRFSRNNLKKRFQEQRKNQFCRRTRTSAVPVAQVREPPQIAEPDSVAEARQQEVQFSRPVSARWVLVLGHGIGVRVVLARRRHHRQRASRHGARRAWDRVLQTDKWHS